MVADITMDNMDDYLPLTFEIMNIWQIEKDTDGKYSTHCSAHQPASKDYISKGSAYDYISKYRETVIILDTEEIW